MAGRDGAGTASEGDGSSAESLSVVVHREQVVVTVNHDYQQPSLVFERDDGCTIRLEAQPKLTGGEVYPAPVFAILGLLDLLAGPYLLVATQVELVGEIRRAKVYRIKEVDLICVAASSAVERLGAQALQDEENYKQMVQHLMHDSFFYYSFHYDLSHNLQSQQLQFLASGSSKGSHGAADLWHRCNSQYVWNSKLNIDKLLPCVKDFGLWFPPIIQGFVGCIHSSLGATRFDIVLISRRNTKRAGTRFNTRGASKEGHVANQVVTEQLLLFPDGTTTSFIQTRGSIPLIWNQQPSLKYEPAIEIDEASSLQPFRIAFEDHLETHKKVVILNLLKEKGSEGKLASEFDRHIKGMDNNSIRYVAFDLHHHCKSTNFSKLKLLTDQIEDEKAKMGYVRLSASAKLEKEQTSVFRTNCKDCLDRTNLVQGVLARLSLIDQLKDLAGIEGEKDLAEDLHLEKQFRCLWADNGDSISIFYAGTPAIRGDVTRNGKQSLQGLWNDGMNSVTRYYLNNMQDGHKQNAIDLLTGKYIPDQAKESPFESTKIETYGMMVLSFLLAIFYSHAPKQIHFTYQLVYVLMWLAVIVLLSKILRVSGVHLVNKPTFFKHN